MAELRGRVPLDTLDQARERLRKAVPLKVENINLANVLHARTMLRSALRDEEMRPQLWCTALQARVGVPERARYESLRDRFYL